MGYGNDSVFPAGLIMSAVVVCILLFTGRKGGELVFRHRIAVYDEPKEPLLATRRKACPFFSITKEAADGWRPLDRGRWGVRYCGMPSMAKERNFAYLSPISRIFLYSGSLRQAWIFSMLSQT